MSTGPHSTPGRRHPISQPPRLRSKGQGCRETQSSDSCPGSLLCPPHPAGPSWGQHREAGVSEAASCQVCKLVSLQSLNFKLDRDCEVPKGREQQRCLRDRGPGSWASGAQGLDPGPAQCSMSAGNALSTPHSALPSLGSPHLSSAQPAADTQVTGPTGRRQGESI